MEEFELEMGGMGEETVGRSPSLKNEEAYEGKRSPQEFVFDGNLSDITEEREVTVPSKEVSEQGGGKVFYSKDGGQDYEAVLSLQATPRSQGPGSLFHKYDSAQRCGKHNGRVLEFYSLKAREFLCSECVGDRKVTDEKRVDDAIHELTNSLELDMFRPLEKKLREAKDYLEK